MAMLLTMLVSVYLFDFKPTIQVRFFLSVSLFPSIIIVVFLFQVVNLVSASTQLFLGIIICMMSLRMYFAPPTMLIDLPLTAKVASETSKDIDIERTSP